MKDEEYQKQLRKLQTELVALQEWVKRSGQRIIIVFEGRDTAGKGGLIRAITGGVSARWRAAASRRTSAGWKSVSMNRGNTCCRA